MQANKLQWAKDSKLKTQMPSRIGEVTKMWQVSDLREGQRDKVCMPHQKFTLKHNNSFIASQQNALAPDWIQQKAANL